MKKNDKRQLDDNFIEQKIADAFGYTDEKLAAELDRFMAEAASERGQRPPEAPEEEFRKILDIVEREKDSQKKNGLRVRRLVKVMAAVAVLGSMVLGGGMWVGARKTRVYEEKERSDMEKVVVFNNNDDNLIASTKFEMQEAYEKIRKELDIQVMELSYLPDEFLFCGVTITDTKGIMEFADVDESFFFYQGINKNTSSISYTSDMSEYETIYNVFLDKEISVYKQQLEDGKVEYSARIVESDKYYLLHGILDIEEFEQIVSNIKLYKE